MAGCSKYVRGEAPTQELSKLNAYDPQYADAKVSVQNVWKWLTFLEDRAASDRDKVKQWIEQFWDELGACQVVKEEGTSATPMDLHHMVHDELLRLKALGSSIVAQSVLHGEQDWDIDDCQLEEIGKMVKELAEKIQDKLMKSQEKAA